jgi:predicted MFS family arabinose efflux permease
MYAISLLLVELASNASLLVAAAIALGISAPPINLSVRPLWRSVVPPEQLRIAYSLDTSSMSAATILGPVMATTLALSRHPASALITCSILILIGGIAVSLLEVVDNWEPEAKPANGRGLFRVPAIRILAIEGLVIGFGMGAFNIGLPALATLHHVPQATSKILAAQSGAMIIGSLLAGVATKKLTPLRAFATNYFFYFTATIPLIWLAPNWQMALGACWLGIFEGAAQVFFLEVLEAVRPIGAAASALGWMWMIEGSGGAIGNALGGAISDQFSPMWCFVILSLTTGAGGLMIYLGRRYFAAANRRFLMRN